MAENSFENDAIKQVQSYLRQLSFHDEDIPPLSVDGIWDDQTRRALMDFQLSRGLTPSGVVDRETFDILKNEYDRSVAMNSPPVMLSLFPREPEGYEISLGERGFLVDTVQYLVSELERLYNFPKYTPSGEYDEKTESIIRDFQRKNGIDVTGRVGRETWDALAVQHNLFLIYGE